MNDKRNDLLSFREAGPGQLECSLDLARLLPTKQERERFEAKWPEFLESDPSNPGIYRRHGNRLVYLSEELIPAITDKRPPLLLVLGNPASHSVKAGMFFSFEGDGREHRFWKNILRPAGILDVPLDEGLSIPKRNRRRKERLLKLDYNSLFRIGLTVFITMPSGASRTWSGVAGIQKLIGAKAMRRIAKIERKRILDCARNFLVPKGGIVAFQKNAWEGLRSGQDPSYRIGKAKSGALVGTLAGMPGVSLFGVAPTRLAGPSRKVLEKIRARQLQKN